MDRNERLDFYAMLVMLGVSALFLLGLHWITPGGLHLW